jgi:hypothetical protein
MPKPYTLNPKPYTLNPKPRCRYLGRTVEVLVEERNVKQPSQVKGRIRQGRSVFFDADIDMTKGKPQAPNPRPNLAESGSGGLCLYLDANIEAAEGKPNAPNPKPWAHFGRIRLRPQRVL